MWSAIFVGLALHNVIYAPVISAVAFKSITTSVDVSNVCVNPQKTKHYHSSFCNRVNPLQKRVRGVASCRRCVCVLCWVSAVRAAAGLATILGTGVRMRPQPWQQ